MWCYLCLLPCLHFQYTKQQILEYEKKIALSTVHFWLYCFQNYKMVTVNTKLDITFLATSTGGGSEAWIKCNACFIANTLLHFVVKFQSYMRSARLPAVVFDFLLFCFEFFPLSQELLPCYFYISVLIELGSCFFKHTFVRVVSPSN